MLKIGVFDSGLGGLTVVKALQEVIKGAELFYIADSKNAPYGEKTSEQILQYSLDIAAYFIKHHSIDALIVACNTATSVAIQILREKYPELILIGTEPGIKPAIEQSKTGKIGVLATPATLGGAKYQKLALALAKGKEVILYEQACPGLVEQIEKGESNSPKTYAMLEKWLAPMRDANVDTIVLGCTHYPLVSKAIETVMQRKLQLIDTAVAIAKHLLALSKEKGHQNEGDLEMYIFMTANIHIDSIKNIVTDAREPKAIAL